MARSAVFELIRIYCGNVGLRFFYATLYHHAHMSAISYRNDFELRKGVTWHGTFCFEFDTFFFDLEISRLAQLSLSSFERANCRQLFLKCIVLNLNI